VGIDSAYPQLLPPRKGVQMARLTIEQVRLTTDASASTHWAEPLASDEGWGRHE
jgi:hypothetical protein